MANLQNVTFDDTDGLEFPQGTTAQRPSSPEIGMARYNTDRQGFEFYNGSEWLIFGFAAIRATGGIISDITIDSVEYRVHTFTSTGTSIFEVEDAGSKEGIEYLIVAGGGAGGNGMGAGGGAGGVIHNVNSTPLALSAGQYNIIVGAGGVGTLSDVRVNGQDSTAFELTAIGGGGATSLQMQRRQGIVNGNPGGSGGGSGASDAGNGFGGAGLQPTSTKSGYTGYGNSGGNQLTASSNYPGGGGGGAGSAGQSPSSNTSPGGFGGSGIQVNIDGNNYYWAGGGGGNGYNSDVGGPGGIGGGGGGSSRSRGGGAGGGSSINSGVNGVLGSDRPGGAAGTNTGGGGGGASWSTAPGGNGGSGIVIIRYPLNSTIGIK